jgi:hypothetical protein
MDWGGTFGTLLAVSCIIGTAHAEPGHMPGSRAASAGGLAEVWVAEATLVRGAVTADRETSAPNSTTDRRPMTPPLAPPAAIGGTLEAPRPPSSAGALPWILAGSAAVLAAGLVYVDHTTDETRAALAADRERGDIAGHRRHRAEFETRQDLARGLAGGAIGLAISAVAVWVFAPDRDPIQSRPYFRSITEQ